MGYQTITPLFHAQSFLEEYRAFKAWTQGFAPEYRVSPHFLALLSAVLFAGSVISPRYRLEQTFGTVDRELLSSQLYNHTVGVIRLANFPQSPCLQTLAAFIVVDTTWLREEQPLTCCAFVGVAVRAAHMLGLHRDPSTFPDLPMAEVKFRRLLWWALVSIDIQVALSSGLPPLIDCSSYSINYLSEAPEADFTRQLPQRRSSKTILGLLVGGKTRFVQKANKFLHILHSTTLSETDMDEILKLSKEIEREMASRQQQIESIERTLSQQTGEASYADDESIIRRAENSRVFGRFARMMLSLLAMKPYAIICGPARRHGLLSYLHEKVPEAVTNCRRYLHRFLRMTQSHDFQPWHWCWPGQHQPIHSLMAIIIDLEENPNAPDIAETVRLVDLAFYMCAGQPNGIVSNEQGGVNLRPLNEGGSEVWNFLKRSRSRVWQKLGLDPNILRCPENANEIRIDGTMASSPASPDLGGELQQDEIWGSFPQSQEDWMTLGTTTDADMPLIGQEFGF